MNDLKTAVYVFSDANMLPAACCTLLSASENLGAYQNSSMTVVGLDLSEEQRALVQRFNEVHSVAISVLDFPIMSTLPASEGRWHKSTLARLFIDELTDPSIDRILYLDADVLAVKSLEGLMSMDLKGKAIGAVDDYISAFPEKLRNRLGILCLPENAGYFNAGVILFDMNALRTGGHMEAARRILHTGKKFAANDQDILNIVFRDAWLSIDYRFNVQSGFSAYIQDPALLHFTGRRKPWQKSISWAHTRFAPIYRRMLATTSWQGFVANRSKTQCFVDTVLSIGDTLGSVRRETKLRSYFGRREV